MAGERPPAAVRLAGVSVVHANGTPALHDLDLEVPAGERVALVGSSGAGKSTLLALIDGRLRFGDAIVSGSVEVLGERPDDLRGRALRRHGRRVASVPQHHDTVGALPVIHNVNAGRLGAWSTAAALVSLLVRPAERDAALAALERVGLEPEVADVRADELSGGQRQRVAVARALRQGADLVTADEPVASVDPALAATVLDALAGDWTTIVSLHQPDVARRFADRVIGLERGRVAFDLAAAEVDDERLARLYA